MKKKGYIGTYSALVAGGRHARVDRFAIVGLSSLVARGLDDEK